MWNEPPLVVNEGNLNGKCYHDELLDKVIRPHFVQNRHHQPLYMGGNAQPHCDRIEEVYKPAKKPTNISKDR